MVNSMGNVSPHENELTRLGGKWSRGQYSLCAGCVTAVAQKRGIMCTILGLSRLEVFSRGSVSRPTCTVLMKRSNADSMCERLVGTPADRRSRRRYKGGSMTQAAVLSGGYIAALFFCPLIYTLLMHYCSGLPQEYALAFAALPVPAFALRLCVLSQRMGCMRMVMSRQYITTAGGSIGRRMIRVKKDAVSAVVGRYTLMGCCSKRLTGWLIADGCGELPYVPRSCEGVMEHDSRLLFPRSRLAAKLLPERRGGGTWGMYAASAVIAPIVGAVVSAKRYELRSIVMTALLPVIAIAMWKALLESYAGHRGGLRIYPDCIELTAANGLTLTELRVLRGKIACIRLIRSPLDRLKGECSVMITPKGAKRGVCCHRLDYSRAYALLERIY